MTIHIALMDEGADVWTSVQAEPVGPDLYLVVDEMPDDESWQFPTGSLVRCEQQKLSGDGGRVAACLVAVARVDPRRVMH